MSSTILCDCPTIHCLIWLSHHPLFYVTVRWCSCDRWSYLDDDEGKHQGKEVFHQTLFSLWIGSILYAIEMLEYILMILWVGTAVHISSPYTTSRKGDGCQGKPKLVPQHLPSPNWQRLVIPWQCQMSIETHNHRRRGKWHRDRIPGGWLTRPHWDQCVTVEKNQPAVWRETSSAKLTGILVHEKENNIKRC